MLNDLSKQKANIFSINAKKIKYVSRDESAYFSHFSSGRLYNIALYANVF